MADRECSAESSTDTERGGRANSDGGCNDGAPQGKHGDHGKRGYDGSVSGVTGIGALGKRRLLTRNAELEAERPLYLRRIAELEMEVEAAVACRKYASFVDTFLRRENKLLHVEVLKHKFYISNVLQAVHQDAGTNVACNPQQASIRRKKLLA